MSDPWTNKWNERYMKKEYAYGKHPNEFLKDQLRKLKPGTILFPAEGEGRNAVYAAKLGWEVHAFDISKEGQNKAISLADENNVSINYQVGELPDLDYNKEQFNVIALIYAHFPPEIRSEYHKLLNQYLKLGGIIIFEAFSKNHKEYKDKNNELGGPQDLQSLFSIEEIKSDFKNYEIIELEEKEVDLKEGTHHNGKSSVIRFIGKKHN